MWTCGRGRHGQLGHGHFNDAGPLQRLEALRGMNVTRAVAGGSHTVCLTDCGSVWSWGACRYGQLGLGDVAFATAAGWESGVPWPCLAEHLNDLDEPGRRRRRWPPHPLRHRGRPAVACGRGKHGALGIGVKGTHCATTTTRRTRGAARGPNDEPAPPGARDRARAREPAAERQRVPRERNTIKRVRAIRKDAKEDRDASNEDVLFAPTPARKRGRRLSASGCLGAAAHSAKAKNREAIRALTTTRRRRTPRRTGGSNAEERRVDQDLQRLRRSVVAAPPPVATTARAHVVWSGDDHGQQLVRPAGPW